MTDPKQVIDALKAYLRDLEKDAEETRLQIARMEKRLGHERGSFRFAGKSSSDSMITIIKENGGEPQELQFLVDQLKAGGFTWSKNELVNAERTVDRSVEHGKLKWIGEKGGKVGLGEKA